MVTWTHASTMKRRRKYSPAWASATWYFLHKAIYVLDQHRRNSLEQQLASQWPGSLALSSATSRERENISDNDHQISNRFHCAVKGNLFPDCSVACWRLHLQAIDFEGCQCSNLSMFSKIQQLNGTMSNTLQYKYLLSAVVSGKLNQNVARWNLDIFIWNVSSINETMECNKP